MKHNVIHLFLLSLFNPKQNIAAVSSSQRAFFFEALSVR